MPVSLTDLGERGGLACMVEIENKKKHFKTTCVAQLVIADVSCDLL